MKSGKKTCFFIAPLRIDDPLTQKWSDNIFNNILVPAVTKAGYIKPIRSDEISKLGLITAQIINHLVESDLVVADLTGHNPNVFYELAVRHIIQKPVIHIIKEGDDLQFDLKNVRIVWVSPGFEKSKTATKQLIDQIRAAEKDPINYTFINDFTKLKNTLTESKLPVSDKQSLFDIFTDMYSSLRVIESQIVKLDNKVSTIKGDVKSIQLASLPSPFVERRLAKFESIKYKVQQKGLADKMRNGS